jgi:hypothetical protein
MSMLYESKNYEYVNETFVNNERVLTFNIPWKELGYESVLKLICYAYQTTKFKIDYSGNCGSCVLLGYYSFISTNERVTLIHQTHKNKIFQLMKQKCIQETQEKTHQLYFNGLINGLFFIDLDYNNILELKILLNGFEYMALNKYTLPSFIRKLSSNNFYLPFDCNPEFNNTEPNSSINFSRLEIVSLQLKTTNPINPTNPINFYVGCKMLNIFKIVPHMGMGNLEFSYINLHNPSNNQQPNNSNSTNIAPIFTYENKLIDGDIQCPVNYENIKENDEYLNCGVCNKNFLLNIVRQWVIAKNTCPSCRQVWANWVIYKNS